MEGTQFTEEQLNAKVQEAIAKYQSDSEAGVQKLIAETKFKDEVLDWVWKVASNPENLIEIFEWNDKVGQEILNKYYDWQTIDEYRESIGYKESQKALDEKLIEKRAKSIYNENKYNEVMDEFIGKMWLDWDQLEEFKNEMNERKGMKSYDPSKLKSYIKKSYKYVTWNSGDAIDNIKTVKNVSKASSINAGNNKWWTDKSTPTKEVKDFLAAHLD